MSVEAGYLMLRSCCSLKDLRILAECQRVGKISYGLDGLIKIAEKVRERERGKESGRERERAGV